MKDSAFVGSNDHLDHVIRLMFTHVSKELNWKVCMEAAQTYEHINDYQACSEFLSNSILNCPDNLRWKVWMIGSRIEYRFGNVRRARALVERCCQEVPSKQVSVALLDYAKFFEMEGNMTRARQIMGSAKSMVRSEWKLFFEAVMMEIRNGFFDEAERMVKQSLEIHFATGRLWATYIQLNHAKARSQADIKRAHGTFVQALNEIPKSGEVWCEGARLHLSPLWP